MNGKQAPGKTLLGVQIVGNGRENIGEAVRRGSWRGPSPCWECWQNVEKGRRLAGKAKASF